MNTLLLIANILTFLAFLLHTFIGDKELKVIFPIKSSEDYPNQQEKWTMARCGWHWVSFDLLLASVGLGLINFTDYFDHEKTLLQILAFYFLGYAIFWFFTIVISKPFPQNYLKLGQWMLLLLLSGLVYGGSI
jgi:hypothetical protein